MTEKNYLKKSAALDQKRLYHTDLPEMPGIMPGTSGPTKPRFFGKDLDAMVKNPRQSAELIKYLIEFIKSL